ncbi:MAG: zinc ribbon domain-containing protein [Leptolyngbyaceae cyanobacterium]
MSGAGDLGESFCPSQARLPSGTVQDYAGCGQKVPKEIQDGWHTCRQCGLELDRDHKAAIQIKCRAVGHPVLKTELQ